jgi:hypothetical protein
MRPQPLPGHHLSNAAPETKAELRAPSRGELEQYARLERIVALLEEWLAAEPEESLARDDLQLAIRRLVLHIPPTILARSSLKSHPAARSAQAQAESEDYIVRNFPTDPNAGRLVEDTKALFRVAEADRGIATKAAERLQAEARPQSACILAAVDGMASQAADVCVKRILREFVAQEQFRLGIGGDAIAAIAGAAKGQIALPSRWDGEEQMIATLERFAEQASDGSFRAELVRVIEQLRARVPVQKTVAAVRLR